MAQNVNAEVIAIGTEILLGELTDTNSVHIARVLRDLGINLYYMTSVGDNKERIADAIRNALDRAQVIITCGGLGPTVDDMTRESIAMATNRGLTYHQSLYDQIAERFAGFKVKMTENNKRQAYLPDDAIVIENPVGTAPSFIVEHGDGVIISLPGVPREMKFLLAENVVPFLRKRYQLGIIKARTLKTAGIGESSLDDLLGGDLLEGANPTIGLNAHMGQIDVRITAKAESEAEADVMIATTEARVRQRAGDYVFGADADRMETVLVELLRQSGGKLAVVQAGIGSVISAVIEDADGSDVLGTVYEYEHPDELRQLLLPEEEEGLRALARAAAKHVCESTGAQAGIAVVSLPDVLEDADIAEGTAVAVYTRNGSRERSYGFGALSDVAREWVRSWALSGAWRLLKERENAR